MNSTIRKEDVKQLVGKHIYAVKKDGSLVSGKLVSVKGNQLRIRTANSGKAQTKAIIPLVLFDLLAIGTSPFAFSPFGFGFPGLFW